MPTRFEKSVTFRKLHQSQGAFIIPNPWDPGTARILSAMGYKALATTSAGCSYSKGIPDASLSLEHSLAHCSEIVNSTDLPVSADLEKGYGDSPETVNKTIQAAVQIGLAGASIEDASADPDNPIYDKALAVERISAAVDAKNSIEGDFVLTARAENYLCGRKDLNDTIARLVDFENAGADVLYAPGLRKLEDIKEVCSALKNPVNVVMGSPGVTLSVRTLESVGVKRISIGSAMYRSAMGAFLDASREMLESGSFTFVENAPGNQVFEKMFSGNSEN